MTREPNVFPRRRRHLQTTAIVACLVAAGIGSAYAGDVKAGRARAQLCQACHGIDGMSKVPDAPNIAGQTEPYLILQLQAFKSGARKNDAMTLVASTLSEKDMQDLAAYFAAIEITVGKVPQ